MHFVPLIQDLAVILGLAGVVSVFFQRIRQPVVLGYLVAGIIAGPNTPPLSWILDPKGIETWSELGVIFLMFSLGLEFSFRKLFRVGISAAVTGPFEAIFMLALGFGAGKLMGWNSMDCIFLGAILSISSTAIIMKTFDEMGLKKEAFAQLTFGVLVVEDLTGILILVALSALGEQGVSGLGLAEEAFKLVLIVCGWIGVGMLTVPAIMNYLCRKSTDEMLLLVSMALCLGMVVVATKFHYSSALGAFVMGSIISEARDHHRIEKLVHPVRDLFAAVFFVSIGMLLKPSEVGAHWKLILIVTCLTIAGKIFSTTLGLRVTGQSTKTALQAGLSLAQIGEFSFIMAGVGLALGVMDLKLYAVAVSVSVITAFTTPYLIRLSRGLTEAAS